MKKFLLLGAFGLFTIGANAQYDQGRILVNGNLNFSSGSTTFEEKEDGTVTTEDGPSTSSFGIGITGMYFLADNLAVGLGIGYTMASQKMDMGNDVTMTQSTSMTLVGPVARYYIPYTDNFAFFGEFGAMFGFGGGKQEISGGGQTVTQETDMNVMMIGIRPAFSYMFTDNIAFELKYGFLGYTSTSMKQDLGGGDYDKVSSSEFGLDLNLSSIMFGISVLF